MTGSAKLIVPCFESREPTLGTPFTSLHADTLVLPAQCAGSVAGRPAAHSCPAQRRVPYLIWIDRGFLPVSVSCWSASGTR